MIDVNRIRSLKTLEDIKSTLNEFLVHPDILEVYIKEYDWSEEDYEADKEMVVELLEKVERRIKSLSNHLRGQAERRDSTSRRQSETKETPSEQ